MRRRPGLWWLVVGLVLLHAGARANVVEERLTLNVAIRHAELGEIQHPVVVTVFRDTRRARSPFMVLGHGRAVTDSERAALGRARYTENSRYFVGLGFTVFVPTRIGYGVTGGPDIEESGPCNVKRYPPAYDAAAQLTLQVIAHARSRPDIEAERGIVVGQSFGGATAITVAARNPAGVRAAVNFAGGGGGRPQTHPGQPCGPENLRDMFAVYGQTARMPTLWLYSENDRYFGNRLPQRWFDAFTQHGGSGRFIRLPAHGEDGHGSFTRNPDAWRPAFEAFLRDAGFAPPP